MVTITIPYNVTSIGEGAFKNYTSITTVYCEPTNPPTCGKYAFDNNANNRKICVNRTLVSTYKNAWSSYANYIDKHYEYETETETIIALDDEL